MKLGRGVLFVRNSALVQFVPVCVQNGWSSSDFECISMT